MRQSLALVLGLGASATFIACSSTGSGSAADAGASRDAHNAGDTSAIDVHAPHADGGTPGSGSGTGSGLHDAGDANLSGSGTGAGTPDAAAAEGGHDAAPGDDGGAPIGMRIVGAVLHRDGTTFVAHGFNMIGLLTPISCGCSDGSGVTANAHMTSTWLKALTDAPWSANMLRFQVSQRGLADTGYSTATNRAAYLKEVVNGVATIRSTLGSRFPVVLSMQDQGIGCGNVDPLPSTLTQAAWDILAPAFATDPYVLFELFNEPQNVHSDAAEWTQWATGGAGGGLTDMGGAVVGHQALVNHIRGVLTADNVLIADVANHAEHADGVLLLTDTSGGRGIAYGIHPYTYDPMSLGVADTFSACESAYATRWQYLPAAMARTVLLTEWNYTATDCGGEAQQFAPQFLGYLSGGITASTTNAHPLGVLAHAGDVLGDVIASWNADDTLSPVTCANPPVGWGKGPGLDLQAYYGALVAAGD